MLIWYFFLSLSEKFLLDFLYQYCASCSFCVFSVIHLLVPLQAVYVGSFTFLSCWRWCTHTQWIAKQTMWSAEQLHITVTGSIYAAHLHSMKASFFRAQTAHASREQQVQGPHEESDEIMIYHPKIDSVKCQQLLWMKETFQTDAKL